MTCTCTVLYLVFITPTHFTLCSVIHQLSYMVATAALGQSTEAKLPLHTLSKSVEIKS